MDFAIPSLIDLLPPSELTLLQAFAIRRTYRSGEVIHERDDSALSVGIVISGHVRLINIAPGGIEQLVSIINPGQNYGDALMFGHSSRTHRALAVGDTVVDHLLAEAFQQLLIHPSIVRAFYTVASHRLVRTLEMLDDARSLPVDLRLAKLLLSLSHGSGDGRIESLQEDLAGLLGVSTVTLAKALRRLRGEGLIETGYRHLRIADLPRLQRWLADQGAG